MMVKANPLKNDRGVNYWNDKRVLVTGGTGFLGTHLRETLKRFEPAALVSISSRDFDLTDDRDVQRMYRDIKPQVVFHLAGLVGGILVNRERPAEFLYQNLMMGTQTMHHASRFGVEKFVAAGAGCGYPEGAPLPLREEDLWSGFPQESSAPYSLAKRLLSIQSDAYYKQHGFKSVIAIPGNVYGEFDNFSLNDGHVIPALVRKFVEAEEFVEVWGSEDTTRDFVYAGDVAEGMIRAAERYDSPQVVNLSSGKESTIGEVCAHLRDITGFKGVVRWNSELPRGQSRRRFDTQKAFRDLDFQASTQLYDGLKRTVEWYKLNRHSGGVRR